MSTENGFIGVTRKVYSAISLLLAIPCAVSLVFWVLLITTYVIGSFLFDLQWLFVEEITEFWLVSFGYLAFSYALVRGRHVITDFVITRLKGQTKRILRVVTTLLAIFAVSYMSWRAFEWFVKGWTRKAVTASLIQTPFWPFYLILFVGLAVFLLGLLLELTLSILSITHRKDYKLRPEELSSREELEELR